MTEEACIPLSLQDLLCGQGRFLSLWWSVLVCLWSFPVTLRLAHLNLKRTGCPAVSVGCTVVSLSKCVVSFMFHVSFQAHMRDLSTGPFRQLSQLCSLCGRTAGFPWESTGTCISLMCCLMTLCLITAAMPASPTRTSFSRSCQWLWRFSQVSMSVFGVPSIRLLMCAKVHFRHWHNLQRKQMLQAGCQLRHGGRSSGGISILNHCEVKKCTERKNNSHVMN